MSHGAVMQHSAARAQGSAPRCRSWRLRVCSSAARDSHATPSHSRRSLLGTALSLPAATLLLAGVPLSAHAEGEAAAPSLVPYFDEEDKFTITVPSGWASGAGDMMPNKNRFSNTAGISRLVAFAPPGKPDINVSVTVTNIAADYTGLGSFGTAQNFADNLVASMDRSYLLRGPAWARGKEVPQVAKLLDAKEAGGMYYASYTVSKADEPTRVISTVVALGDNGRRRRFYTVNASCTEGEQAQYGALLKQVVNSFRAPQ